MKSYVNFKVVNALYKAFVNKYGNIAPWGAALKFWRRIDDEREINDQYVDYLYDFVVDFNL